MNLILIITTLLIEVYSGEAFRCAICNRTLYCNQEPIASDCSCGLALDICNCCYVCGNAPGEQCGGNWLNFQGNCGPGLICESNSTDSAETGICVVNSKCFC